ncbi:D-alanyl-D-alanine carboxypeptidase (penicillin-binding protein 5/6) [Hephaestia caeni]|uniref:serine-type D-Ala-D-Ala carboxypeptidase n=1 Tax=Hephaestia caeni TaxID=645617 RepID=A0A397PBP7_9SPHN|nr:D-alanyl-D-alanine carboxypeptidase family protein [Hephaestia caeni]RIA45823.1 D-alanyl-D-alanine carboxypeptidase (penicillin-binding protein 5/6) [Hephaestia caeni]
MKKLFAASIAAIALAYPTMAAAPPFDTPAPVAFMKDLSSGAILYSKNPDQRIPPASLAKMMTVYLAFDMVKQGRVKLDQMVTVRPETWERWHGPKAGSTMFLSPNQQVSVRDLLYGIITVSGNDACVVLAEGLQGTEQAWVSQMNAEAKKLGMANSHFGTSNGWPDEGVTYVTARDLAKLAEATIEEFPELYKHFYSKPDFTWGKTAGGEPITQPNRDPLLGRVEGADGLKTGHTEESGYSVTGSAEQNGRRLVMVMSGMTSFNQRISESVRFMNWGFRAWQAHPIVAKGKQVSTAEVQMGDAGTVGLVAPRDLTVTVPSGALPAMQAKVVYAGPIKAPIKAGQHIADLVIQMPDTGPQTVPLVAASDVGEAGFFRRAWNGLTSLFG